MKVYHDIGQIPPMNFPVVTIGTFDGVHLGHHKILERLNKTAEKNQGESVIITFWPHPRLVLYPEEKDLKLLTTFDEKIKLLNQSGVEHLVKVPFTKEFSEWSSERFIREILVDTIGTKSLVIGYDHRFGKNREGSFEHLSKYASTYGFTVEEIPKQEVDDVTISSTKIRKALLQGDIALGNDLLGHPYELTGTVVQGDQIGQQLGFPTANILVEESYKLIPGDGIYAVKIQVMDEVLDGMLYIGNRPTLNGKHRTIEVNIFDFSHNIYQEQIRVLFYQQIRGDVKFKSLPELKEQLAKDKIETTNYFKKLSHG